MNNPHFLTVLLAVCFFLASQSGVNAQQRNRKAPLQVLVSVKEENKILRFALSEKTGKLTPQKPQTIKGGPAPLCLSQDRTRLYAGLRDSKEIATIQVGPGGELRGLAVADIGFNPVHITMDPEGGHLWAASYSEDCWASFPIDQTPNGKLSVIGKPCYKREGVLKAHQIVIRKKEDWIMVPALGENAVHIYNRSRPLAGRIGLVEFSVKFEKGSGPRHLAWHPTEPWFYIANETNSTVARVEWDAKNREITPNALTKTIPKEFQGSNSCAQIKVSPDGDHLYVSNRGHDSIAVFDLTSKAPGVALIENIKTEATPRAFAIGPRGRWLAVAGQDSGFLQLYERDPGSGLLTPRHRVEVGKKAYWVEIFEPPEK